MAKQRCLVVVVSAVVFAVAGCGGKSNRKATYHPPSTQATTANADQEDATAKSDARNLVAEVETCFVDQQMYTACKKPAGTKLSLGSGPGQVEVSAAAVATYTVAAHSKSGANFNVTKDSSGALKRTCDKPGKGGCPAGGSW